MTKPAKSPIEVAERVAARNSACAGALAAFCLFSLIWMTASTWLNETPLNETNANRGESNLPNGDSGSRQRTSGGRHPSTENRGRFQPATWNGKSFLTRATSHRFLIHESDAGEGSIEKPLQFPRSSTATALRVPNQTANAAANLEFRRDQKLPPPQVPVPIDDGKRTDASTTYGVVVRLPAAGEDSDREPVPAYEELPSSNKTAESSLSEKPPRLPEDSAIKSNKLTVPPGEEGTDEVAARKRRLRTEFHKLREKSRSKVVPSRIAARGEELPSGILADPSPSPSPSPELNPHGDLESELTSEVLPGLEEELARYAGGQIHRSLIDSEHGARLPEENEFSPQPITAFQKFLGNDAVCLGGRPSGPIFENGNWGECGFTHERRLTIYGQYQVFGLAFKEAGRRFDGIGHSATIDVDFRLTGTERVHVQFQLLGRNDEGGSFWKLNQPRSYQDNSSIVPERFWIEGELYSLFSDDIDDQFTPHDWHYVAGKFPFVLHNELLLNDEILGLAVNSNTNMPGTLSNLNVQFFGGRDDTAPWDFRSTMAGVHASLDYQARFYELTCAHQWDDSGTLLDADFLAASATRFYGPVTLAARAMGRFDEAGDSSGLFVGEANWTRKPGCNVLNAESLVAYATGFHATSGWQSMGGGDFDRLRSNFAVNPLVSISRRGAQSDVSGAALGVQIFRCHEDESWTPEVSFENRDTGQVWATGMTFQRKLSSRWFLECSGVRTWTNDGTLRDRTGLLLSTTWLL